MAGFKSTSNLLLNRSQSCPTKRPSANSCEADSYEAAQSTAIHCFPLKLSPPLGINSRAVTVTKTSLVRQQNSWESISGTVTVTGLQ